jgi:hypothetical protein
VKDIEKHACFMINGHRVEFIGDDEFVRHIFIDGKEIERENE